MESFFFFSAFELESDFYKVLIKLLFVYMNKLKCEMYILNHTLIWNKTCTHAKIMYFPKNITERNLTRPNLF
jgi:hypothetical protein